jgi:uncharacterized lipoprotein YehR (DUF1307 family)
LIEDQKESEEDSVRENVIVIMIIMMMSCDDKEERKWRTLNAKDRSGANGHGYRDEA